MPIFTPKVLANLADTVQTIARIFFDATPLVLTPDEFTEAFVAPEHLAPVRTMQDLFGGPLTKDNFHTKVARSDGSIVPVTFCFHEVHPITIPPYACNGLQPTCSEATKDKITAWVDERYRLGCMMGDAVESLHFLNNACGDLAAMRLVFPVITTIMGRSSSDPNDRTVLRAAKLSDTTKYGRLPKLSPEQRARLTEASALVNSACLIKDGTPSWPGGAGTAYGFCHNVIRRDTGLFGYGGRWL